MGPFLSRTAGADTLQDQLLRLGETVRLGEAVVPPCRPGNLGDPEFRRAHGLKYAYAGGSMANGIASLALAEALAREGLLAFFGSAGLSPEKVEEAIGQAQSELDGLPIGFNIINSPNEPNLEAAVIDLYLRREVRLVEASAYVDLSLPLVRYRVKGLQRRGSGEVESANRVVAKVSRVEVASRFMSPPPEALLRELVSSGEIDHETARMAEAVPMADDVTAEADSGGHTDNRPALTLFPSIAALRDRLQEKHRFARPVRVGAAGGIATPASAAAAFAMGAAYVMTGSVNQACAESGTSDAVRTMLAAAGQADTAMAPAADMFEMGVKVQVLKRGSLFAMRAGRLYDLYRTYDSLDAIPQAARAALERDYFRAACDDIWRQTREYFLRRDPAQAERGERDPKHKMALVFRWYLGQASRWANSGEPGRQVDYQVWCGPAMGAFNEWAKGSFLEDPRERRAAVVALNLMAGAAYLTRAHSLRCQGHPVPAAMSDFKPRRRPELDRLID
ncbi:MAG: PfaD family polyunsaturated fatty acid/polyketide biosynthesis protein [Elusimicrobia bacterium]|nr:PfaD family polyunsaturated fatty acid/polyketide biosynthesis protein [Elusimicrobiota bacterium]